MHVGASDPEGKYWRRYEIFLAAQNLQTIMVRARVVLICLKIVPAVTKIPCANVRLGSDESSYRGGGCTAIMVSSELHRGQHYCDEGLHEETSKAPFQNTGGSWPRLSPYRNHCHDKAAPPGNRALPPIPHHSLKTLPRKHIQCIALRSRAGPETAKPKSQKKKRQISNDSRGNRNKTNWLREFLCRRPDREKEKEKEKERFNSRKCPLSLKSLASFCAVLREMSFLIR
ncbi:hypothetical protein TPHA_0J00180 [Tetrapisispora phaffii CBS 4417]|uniref:Uncharacterized protein n=1 Tax=Tetrapisispora phaffii (strain ATCC 24235 / CBS 4417 / NBRC 1672 / NRRL Y-8282 / UCD 70-5) TaxID=1071381 RepID=G8BYA0_TETPH|nr:hypothetical protein TPHA_0J00180 [Tetrapisispora phaffii CBS 4417]CCE64842.1 hypothetical protein TPHA_0J00180 [Tetrapisispora phaffii CBS 4417]